MGVSLQGNRVISIDVEKKKTCVHEWTLEFRVDLVLLLAYAKLNNVNGT